MSKIDADLLFHLVLDEIKNGKFPDASGNGRDGAIKGAVTLVPDDVFGACAGFDGALTSFIEVPDSADLRIEGDLTLEAWVNVSEQQADWVGILMKGQRGKENYGLWYHKEPAWLFQSTSGSKYQGCRIGASQQTRSLNTWYHMAAVIQNNAASLYIHDAQGRFLLQQPQKATWGKPDINTDPLRIGYANIYKSHNGRIANVRVYKRALSQAEIERDIREDRMSLVAFRKSHPIDFRLYDEDEQAVLYITDDPAGHNLNLELRNTSAQAILFNNGQNAAASETNHHFALRFRPGTLSDAVINALTNSTERAKILKEADQWDLSFPANKPAANETASIYLLYKGVAKSFQPNESRKLTLQRMSAAPGSGARGTQVELIPRQLTADGGDATPITGSRAQYLHIANQRGKKYIPLHVGFVGGNNVLFDNDPNSKGSNLKLRIANVSNLKDGVITLNPENHSEPSKFIISFDAELENQPKEWALVKKSDSKNVKVSVDKRDIKPEGIEGETPEWIITFKNATALARGESILVDISGIRPSSPEGHANIYAHYKNIPGYWDGQFVCPVEKSPIVYTKDKVGVGTATPAKTLDVNGDAAISGSVNIGALQLKGGPVVKSILKDVSGGGNYAESLPNVAMVVELIEKALQKFAKDVPFNLCTITIPNVYPDPNDLPRITITGNTVSYAGSFWVEALDWGAFFEN